MTASSTSNRFGYGIVNATRFVAEDPAQYPDENPLFAEGASPTFDEAYNPPSTTPVAETVAAPQSPSPMMGMLLLFAVLVLLAITGFTILIVIAVRRRRRSTPSES